MDYKKFMEEYEPAPCTREALDPILEKYSPGSTRGVPYPDEWYADKNNRLAGEPTGHIRYQGDKIIWVPYNKDEK